MLDERQHVPYYVQIKSYLRKIAAEKKPHEAIPSEAQLSDMFKVSRGTVKQAIMDLVYEGLLYREQGKGTFVCEQRVTRSFERLPSFTADIRQMGKGPNTRILHLKQAMPSPHLQQLFDLRPDEPLTKFKRLVSVEDSPVVVLTSYLNPHVYPEVLSSDINESLYEALKQKYGVVPVRAHDTYSIVSVSPQTAELLKCKKSDCVCYSQRTAYLSSGLAVEYVESFIRSDRFKLDVRIGSEPTSDHHPTDSAGDEASAPHYGVDFRNVII